VNDAHSPEPSQVVAAELLALAREQFTEEDIRRCLQELQGANETSGKELKDFLSDLEKTVEQV
jgi:hypothetical protein